MATPERPETQPALRLRAKKTGTPTADALGLLGLARRAGAVAAGTERARLAVRRGEARLVVVASDAAEGQLKKIDGIVRANGVPRVVLVDRVGLGGAVGGPPLSALAVTDSGLAKQVLSRLSGAVPKESRFK